MLDLPAKRADIGSARCWRGDVQEGWRGDFTSGLRIEHPLVLPNGEIVTTIHKILPTCLHVNIYSGRVVV